MIIRIPLPSLQNTDSGGNFDIDDEYISNRVTEFKSSILQPYSVTTEPIAQPQELRDWNWKDPLLEGVAGQVNRLRYKDYETDRLRSMLGKTDKEFIDLIHNGIVNREEWPLGRMPQEERDTLLSGKIADRENWNKKLDIMNKHILPDTPHKDPEGFLDTLGYKALGAIPGVTTGVAEYSALGPLALGLGTLEGNQQSKERVYKSLSSKVNPDLTPKYSQEEALKEAQGIKTNLADLGIRGGTMAATLALLGKTPTIDGASKLSPYMQTATNIGKAALVSGRGDAVAEALTQYRGEGPYKPQDILAAGLEGAIQTGLMGTLGAFRNRKALQDMQAQYKINKAKQPIDVDFIELPPDSGGLPQNPVSPNEPNAPSGMLPAQSTLTQTRADRLNDVLIKHDIAPIGNGRTFGDVKNEIAYYLSVGAITPDEVQTMVNEAGYTQNVADDLLGAGLERLRPQTENLNIQEPSVETIKDFPIIKEWSDPLSGKWREPSNPLQNLERPNIERPFEMNDPLLQAPIDTQRLAQGYHNAFEQKQAIDRNLLNIWKDSHLNNNGELVSPPKTHSTKDFVINTPQVFKDLLRQRLQLEYANDPEMLYKINNTSDSELAEYTPENLLSNAYEALTYGGENERFLVPQFIRELGDNIRNRVHSPIDVFTRPNIAKSGVEIPRPDTQKPKPNITVNSPNVPIPNVNRPDAVKTEIPRTKKPDATRITIPQTNRPRIDRPLQSILQRPLTEILAADTPTAPSNRAWQDPLKIYPTREEKTTEPVIMPLGEQHSATPPVKETIPNVKPQTPVDEKPPVETTQGTPIITPLGENPKINTDTGNRGLPITPLGTTANIPPVKQPEPVKKQPPEITSDNSSDANGEGFINTIKVPHMNNDYEADVYLDKTDTGEDYFDIVNPSDGDSIAVYRPDTDEFFVRPEYQNTGWVRNLEDTFREKLEPSKEIIDKANKGELSDGVYDFFGLDKPTGNEGNKAHKEQQPPNFETPKNTPLLPPQKEEAPVTPLTSLNEKPTPQASTAEKTGQEPLPGLIEITYDLQNGTKTEKKKSLTPLGEQPIKGATEQGKKAIEPITFNVRRNTKGKATYDTISLKQSEYDKKRIDIEDIDGFLLGAYNKNDNTLYLRQGVFGPSVNGFQFNIKDNNYTKRLAHGLLKELKLKSVNISFLDNGGNFPDNKATEQEENPPKNIQQPALSTDNITPSQKIAKRVREHLLHSNEPLSKKGLTILADKAFGGTQGEGKHTVKDDFDAMEMGVNQFILESKITANDGYDERNLEGINNLMNMLPTQSNRTDDQIEFQQFSTPPTLAYIVNWLANVQKGDTVLEPSAGLGGLAVFAKNAGANLILNELDPRRADLLESMGLGKVYRENAENIADILLPKLGEDGRPDKVIMNPPFSSTAGRIKGQRDSSNAIRHVEQALQLMKDGGRLVAILGKGTTSKQAWKNIESKYNVRAAINIDGDNYRKYGTSYDNMIVVIDKNGATPEGGTVTGNFKSLTDIINSLGTVKGSVSTAHKNAHKENKTPTRNTHNKSKKIYLSTVEKILEETEFKDIKKDLYAPLVYEESYITNIPIAKAGKKIRETFNGLSLLPVNAAYDTTERAEKNLLFLAYIADNIGDTDNSIRFMLNLSATLNKVGDFQRMGDKLGYKFPVVLENKAEIVNPLIVLINNNYEQIIKKLKDKYIIGDKGIENFFKEFSSEELFSQLQQQDNQEEKPSVSQANKAEPKTEATSTPTKEVKTSKPETQVKTPTVEAKPDMSLINELTVDFKTAFDKVDRTKIGYAKVHEVREKLNWPRDMFDRVIQYLWDKRIISLGQLDDMTPEQMENSFMSKAGILMGGITWRDNSIEARPHVPTINFNDKELMTKLTIDFKKAFDKFDEGFYFVRICDVRKEMNLPYDEFDDLIRYLRRNGTISLYAGDNSLMTPQEVEDSFIDENGFGMGTMTWNGKSLEQLKNDYEKLKAKPAPVKEVKPTEKKQQEEKPSDAETAEKVKTVLPKKEQPKTEPEAQKQPEKTTPVKKRSLPDIQQNSKSIKIKIKSNEEHQKERKSDIP